MCAKFRPPLLLNTFSKICRTTPTTEHSLRREARNALEDDSFFVCAKFRPPLLLNTFSKICTVTPTTKEQCLRREARNALEDQ